MSNGRNDAATLSICENLSHDAWLVSKHPLNGVKLHDRRCIRTAWHNKQCGLPDLRLWRWQRHAPAQRLNNRTGLHRGCTATFVVAAKTYCRLNQMVCEPPLCWIFDGRPDNHCPEAQNCQSAPGARRVTRYQPEIIGTIDGHIIAILLQRDRYPAMTEQ